MNYALQLVTASTTHTESPRSGSGYNKFKLEEIRGEGPKQGYPPKK